MSEPMPPTSIPERPARRASRQITDQGLRDITASAMTLLALLTVCLLAWRGSEAATGALIGILSAATGYLLRSKLEAAKP